MFTARASRAAWIAAATLAAWTAWANEPGRETPTEVLRFRATADVGLCDAGPRQRDQSAGKAAQWTLRNTQEIALVRFDLRDVAGREVLAATLRLHRQGPDRVRHLRVSTVNQDWVEGSAVQPGGAAGGATFLHADATPGALRSWAFAGSSVADVIMTSGNSLDGWAERTALDDGWIAVALPSDLVYAMALGDSDGLAIAEGGNPANQATTFSSVQSPGREPCLEVQLGRRLDGAPKPPAVRAEPAPDRAHLTRGALRLVIDPDENVFCYRVLVDGRLVPRWRVKHPQSGAPTVICLDDLPPDRPCDVQVEAVGRSGKASPAARLAARTSPRLARNVSLGRIGPLPPREAAPHEAGPLAVWPLPALVKVHPVTGAVIGNDLGNASSPLADLEQTNAVWDGTHVRLFGCRGEYVSFQLCLENRSAGPLGPIAVRPRPLVVQGGQSRDAPPRGNVRQGRQDRPGVAGTIPADCIETSALWYARNRLGEWQPAYCIPIDAEAALAIPAVPDRMGDQRTQLVHVDVYLPKDAAPGIYVGSIGVSPAGVEAVEIPLVVEVVGLTLSERLCFWPELSAPRMPDRAIDYYRLAHQHRCVLNPWAWRPKLSGAGAQTRVDWTAYDRQVGPLLSGEAFARNRRAGVPIECMVLPFEDSWPGPLTPQTYRYSGYWPGEGDDPSRLIEHYQQGPLIDDGLTDSYKAAFTAVQRQFIEHFHAKGYTQTQMQCFFGGKASHRVRFGANVWWTTDEPCFLSDWLALQFFTQLWTEGRGQADPRLWPARADVSRPQWQGLMLAGRADVVYYGAGGMGDAAMVRRCRTLAQDTGAEMRAYAALPHEALSATENVVLLLDAWCDGANALAVWQTLGADASLDDNHAGADGGAALLVPGDRFGIGPVADLRLKALRDAQQLIEYLVMLARQRGLTREELKAVVHEATRPLDQSQRGDLIDDADSIEFGSLSAWQIAQLRRRILQTLLDGQGGQVANRPGHATAEQGVSR